MVYLRGGGGEVTGGGTVVTALSWLSRPIALQVINKYIFISITL